jgi:transketolase
MDLAKADRSIYLLVGDVGFSLVESFRQEYPTRFLNVGIAEQNMIGISTGLALSGKNVFCYSLANFPTIRCLEQIRNDACYHNANVKIISSGGGLTYGSLGVTHHVTEDLAIMRALPNMIVVAPGDPVEASLATRAVAEWQGPCYLRLAKTGDPVVYKKAPHFQIGKAIKLRDGKDVTLIVTGGMLLNTVQAAEQLAQEGIQTRVLSMHTIKPLDTEAILSAAAETGAIVTIEEHSVVGGLGGAVAEVLAESGTSVIFKRIAVNDSFCTKVGSQDYLRKLYSLTVDGISKAVQSLREAAFK